ncbi:MAG: hypothetical protein RMY35_008820 [Nostoc sp. DedSLP01]
MKQRTANSQLRRIQGNLEDVGKVVADVYKTLNIPASGRVGEVDFPVFMLRNIDTNLHLTNILFYPKYETDYK